MSSDSSTPCHRGMLGPGISFGSRRCSQFHLEDAGRTRVGPRGRHKRQPPRAPNAGGHHPCPLTFGKRSATAPQVVAVVGGSPVDSRLVNENPPGDSGDGLSDNPRSSSSADMESPWAMIPWEESQDGIAPSPSGSL